MFNNIKWKMPWSIHFRQEFGEYGQVKHGDWCVRLMNKDQSNIVLGTATPDIDLAPTSSEQTLNFFAWMEQIDQATPVTPGAVTANATYVLDYK